MADDITTVLKFVGEASSAEAAIKSLVASLKNAAASTAQLFSNIASGSSQASGAVAQAGAAADRAAKSTRQAADNTLAYAQASARLQVAQGNAAGAVETLKAALAGVDRNTVAALRAQTQLVSVEAQLAGAAGKAETAILREAQAMARLQQIAGDTPGAIKTLSDALEKVANKSSLPALRAELQKTYLDTGYANSPLIGALERINSSLSTFSPLLGSAGSGLQRVIGFAAGAAQSFQSTGDAVEKNAQSAGTFFQKIKQANQAIVNFSKDQEGSATLSLGLSNALDLAARAGDRLKESMRRAADSVKNFFARFTGRSSLITLFAGSDKLETEVKALNAELPKLAKASNAAGTGLSGMAAGGGAAAAALAVAVAAVVAFEVAILKLAKSAALELAPLDRLTERTGIAEVELFKLKIASAAVGVTFETVVEQIDFFNSALAKAVNEGSANRLSKQLKQFGIDAREAANNPGAAFEELRRKIGAIENPTQRMAAVTSFFGEEGRKLVPVFIELSRNAGQYQRVLDQLGGAQGVKRIIQSSAELDRELKRLGGEFKVLQIIVAREVIPAMVVAVQGLIPVIRAIGPVAAIAGKAAAKGLLLFVAVVQTATQQVQDLALAYAALQAGQFKLAARSALNSFGRTIQGNLQILELQLAAVGTGVDKAFGKFKPGGDNAEKASKQATDALRAIENQLREEEEINRANQEALKRTFDQKLIDETEFVQKQQVLIQSRLTSTLDLLQKEEELVRSRSFAKDQRAPELERIERDRRAARRRTDEEIEKSEIESQQRLDRLAIQRAEAEVETERAALARRQALIEAAIDERRISYEAGERELSEIARREIELRLGLANAELERAGANTAERAVAIEKIRALEIQLAVTIEEAETRIRDARRRDAQVFREFISARVDALLELRKAEIDAQAARTALALQRGQVDPRRAEQQEIERRRELVRLESLEREREIERQAEQLTQQARDAQASATVLLQIEQQKNAALRAERERAGLERQALIEQERAVELTPEVGEQAALVIAGIETTLERQLTLFERLRVEAAVTAQSLQQSLQPIGAVFVQMKDAIVNSLADTIAAFAAGKLSIRQAAAALYAEALKPLKDFLLKKARAEFALAIADAAMGNFAGAAKHTLAGVALSAAAGLIDVGGAAIAGGGGGAVGGAISAGGGGATGTGQTTSAREINQNTPRPEPVVIVLRAQYQPGIIVERVIEDFKNNGRTRDLLGGAG